MWGRRRVKVRMTRRAWALLGLAVLIATAAFLLELFTHPVTERRARERAARRAAEEARQERARAAAEEAQEAREAQEAEDARAHPDWVNVEIVGDE